MKKYLTKALKGLASFISEQYLVLFLIVTTAAKLDYVIANVFSGPHPDYFNNSLRCSFFSACVIFLPLLFIKKKKYKNTFAIILALLISILLFIDNVYFSYFIEIPSIGLLNIVSSASKVGPAIFSLIHIGQFIYFIDIILILIIIKPVSSLVVKLQDKYSLKNPSLHLPIAMTLVSTICLFLSFSYFGISDLGVMYNRGYNNVYVSRHYGILAAHFIDVMKYIEQENSSLSKYETDKLNDWISQNKPDQQTSSYNGIAKDANVILIQVESLGAFAIGADIKGQEITPNLNNLAKSTNYFPNDRFIVGGGHTSDTDFVVNSSYFPIDDSAIFVRYGLDDFTSLPKTLLTNGYNSADIYHGYIRSFWNRDIALSSLGYQKFYAANNYQDGEKLNMGLNDGDFLNQTFEYIKNQPSPSLSSIITLSSHVPFEITDLTNDLGLDPNDYPDQIAGYIEDIHYVDKVLGEFFDKLKAEGMYDKSLIILYGDHTPVLSSFTAGSITYNPDSDQGKEVPLFVKLPNQTTGTTYENTGTNLDIMPTIFDLTGIQTNQLMFGQSLFAQTEGKVAVCPNHLVAFTTLGNCDEAELTEKDISSKIIRYNQFEYLN